MKIEVRSEAKRGCGYRKDGGIYLVAPGLSRPCGRLPLPLGACPTCGIGVKPSRGWTWVDAWALFSERSCQFTDCQACPLSNPLPVPFRAGLLWIGEQFYACPADWIAEANHMGVSRRIPSVPRDFVLGETWVLVAHRKAIVGKCPVCRGAGFGCDECRGVGQVERPGIFHCFKPKAIERIVRGDETEEELEGLAKQGFTLVKVVPIEPAPAKR